MDRMKLEILENNAQPAPGRPPLLFVHGMWHGAWVWEPCFLPAFEKLGYKAYALSLSNHAGSPSKKAFNLLRIKDYVADLEQVIRSLEQPPILIGHSMGGFVVQKYLEKRRLPGAVLMAPVAPFGILESTLNVLRKFPLTFLKANITLNLIHVINDPRRYRYLLCSAAIDDKAIEEYVTKINSESYLAYMDMLGFDLVNTKSIDTPLMITGGGQDHSVTVNLLKRTCARYGLTPVIFKSMGHNMMFEPDAKKVVAAIDKWIKSL